MNDWNAFQYELARDLGADEVAITFFDHGLKIGIAGRWGDKRHAVVVKTDIRRELLAARDALQDWLS